MKRKLLIRILILLICMVTGHRARGAGHRAQSTGRRAQSTGCRVQKAIMTASGCRPCTAHHALYIVPLSNVFIPVVRLSYQNNKQKYNTLDTNPANQKKKRNLQIFSCFFYAFQVKNFIFHVVGRHLPGVTPGLLDGDTSSVRNHPIKHS